jgi:hypothetical protein
MPALANIVVNDGAGTPVSHTFNPLELSDGYVFEDRSGGIPIGYHSIFFKMKRPPTSSRTDQERVARVTLNVSFTVLEQTSPSTGTGIEPAPTVAYVLRSNQEWLLPMRSTQQNRKDLRAITANTLADTNVKKVLEDLDFWY